MTTEEQELRELDAWIEINLFGWVPETRKMHGGEKNVVGFGLNTYLHAGDRERDFCPASCFPRTRYTTSPADALAVLEKCRERVRNQSDSECRYSVRIDCDYPFTIYRLESKFMECAFRVESEKLTEAIALFAKKLFEK